MPPMKCRELIADKLLLLCLIAASAHAGTMKEAPEGMYIFSGDKLSATNKQLSQQEPL